MGRTLCGELLIVRLEIRTGLAYSDCRFHAGIIFVGVGLLVVATVITGWWGCLGRDVRIDENVKSAASR